MVQCKAPWRKKGQPGEPHGHVGTIQVAWDMRVYDGYGFNDKNIEGDSILLSFIGL